MVVVLIEDKNLMRELQSTNRIKKNGNIFEICNGCEEVKDVIIN